ncbi:hypothetical protein BDB01DRAFT_768656 [Pilobolus umbonatus]|nr:hypothetical protein BDB01DRAFT_768656 [Pilobolus umbonatus]
MNTAHIPIRINNSRDIIQLLLTILIDYVYRMFILTPLSVIKSCAKHPVALALLFLFLFPFYLFTQFIFTFLSLIKRMINPKKTRNFMTDQRVFNDNMVGQNESITMQLQQLRLQSAEGIMDDSADMQIWLERCSICFESTLDLCLEYCKDQFCLDCFQKYVSEVVKSSWGLDITKIKCPVCRIYIPQSEWTKYVPTSISELYDKFNRPYRSFSRYCPHCETEVMPCDYKNSTMDHTNRSRQVASTIKEFYRMISDESISEQQINFVRNINLQQDYYHLFDYSEWKNSTISDIHYQMISLFISLCQTNNQLNKVNQISQNILQLDIRPDNWRRVQFDHISLFPNTQCPTCTIPFCLQCGYESHHGLNCNQNMKRLIDQRLGKSTADDDHIRVLQWKVKNSRQCPCCSIMINRDEGCNKVDCTLCGFSFCWICRSPWSDSCGFFHCHSANNETLIEDTVITDTNIGDSSGSNNQIDKTELGVPDVSMIQYRLNSI